MKVATQDPTGRVELWMREKPALELSGCATKEDFVQAHEQGELAFPFMSSFRVHIQPQSFSNKGQASDVSQANAGGDASIVIVEAQRFWDQGIWVTYT